MGCNQSDTGQIVVPGAHQDIQPITSSELIEAFAGKSKNTSKAQVNDMPNDEYHFKIFDQAKELCNQRNLEKA